MKYIISTCVAVALLTMGLVASSFGDLGYTIGWDNDSGAELGAFYVDQAGLTPVPMGDTVKLAVPLGGTNFVLATGAMGDGVGADGLFEISTVVASNLLFWAQGQTLEIMFYLTTDGSGPYGLVWDSINCPAPPTTPPAPLLVNADLSFSRAANTQLTSGGAEVYGQGFYIIPEPSTIMLVGLGLLGAVGLMRRRRS